MRHCQRSGYLKVIAMCAALSMWSLQFPGQTALPPSSPTQADRTASQMPFAQPASAELPASVAVRWDGTDLRIDARNASLNAVLHAVAIKTHLKVTGSAPDERIFGTYGPGPVSQVLPSLFEGVAVNLLLTERQGGSADELVLSSRSGGPTPAYVPTQQDSEMVATPSPDNPGLNGYPPRGRPATPKAFAGRRVPEGNDPVVPDNGVAGRDNGISGGSSNGQNGADNGVNGRDNGQNGTDNGLNNSNSSTNSTDSTDSETSPATTRTPQEIFEQLQRLRQQQATPQ